MTNYSTVTSLPIKANQVEGEVADMRTSIKFCFLRLEPLKIKFFVLLTQNWRHKVKKFKNILFICDFFHYLPLKINKNLNVHLRMLLSVAPANQHGRLLRQRCIARRSRSFSRWFTTGLGFDHLMDVTIRKVRRNWPGRARVIDDVTLECNISFWFY